MILRTLIPLLVTAAISTAAMAGPIQLTFKQKPSDQPWTASATITLPDDSLITTGRYQDWFSSDYDWPIPDGVHAEATVTLPLFSPFDSSIIGSMIASADLTDDWWSTIDLTYLGNRKAKGGFSVSGDDFHFSFYPPDWVSVSLQFDQNAIFSSPGLKEYLLYEDSYWATASLDRFGEDMGLEIPGYWQIKSYRPERGNQANQANDVPEPGTLLLLTGALAGLALSRRRKQAS